MRRLKKTIAILSSFFLLAALTACSEKSEEVYGKITKISDAKITIETGTYKEPSKPDNQKKDESNGASPESGTAPDNEKKSDSTAGKAKTEQKETPPAKPDGESGSGQGGQPPADMGGFTSDGGSASYILSDNINISSLQAGVLVKLTLDEDTVTAIETIEQPGGNAPGSGSDSETGTTDTSATYTVDGKKQTSENKNYEASDANVSAVLVQNKGTLTLEGGSLTKSGDTTSDDESNFYGLNAILAASGGSTVKLDGTTLTSSGSGSNAIFSTGKGSKITAKNFKIYTTGDSSRGLDATYGGTILASGGDITTKGAHCAPIATDRGEGTVKVSNTTVNAEGDGSPCIYSTGAITASNVTGNATGSQIAVVEGKNSITLSDCILQGAGKHGIMLYQSTSGDAAKGEASFSATGSKLTTTSDGPMFYITNTDASATLEDTSLYYSSGILVNAAGNNTNNWGKTGENGGNFALTGISQKLEGDITCDKISTVALTLTDKTTFTGTVNAANTAKSISVTLDESSTWKVTGDSYLSAITNKDASCKNIKSGGYAIYYDKNNGANKWLGGKTLSLSGGGKLTPAE